MDSSNVLTALQEAEKWRQRRDRLQGRLESVHQRREVLEEELARVRREQARLAEVLYRPEERTVDPTLLPFHLGR